MKVLFTKKIDEKIISQKIGNDFFYECIKFIDVETQMIPTKNIDTRGKSFIFTSVNGVRSFLKNQLPYCDNFTHLNTYNRIYCVGQKTKKELRKNAMWPYKSFPYASDLLNFLINNTQDEKFMHFCGNLSLDIVDNSRPLENIWYRKVVLYHTHLLYPQLNRNYDAVVFFSPSGVQSFMKYNSLENLTIFSIGKTTEKELKKYTYKEIFTSSKAELDDLLDIIKSKIK